LMQICGQVCANILLESTSFSRMIAPVHLSVFTHLWKIEKNHILGFMCSAQSLDKNIIKNMWKVIKSHVQKELSATEPYQACSNNLKQSSLNLYLSALCIHSAMNSFCYCAQRIYNKILKRQVSAFVEIMLFTMFEFNWQKTNQTFVPPPLWHTWPHAVDGCYDSVTIMPSLPSNKKLPLKISCNKAKKCIFGEYLTTLWPWPLTFWPQKLTCSSLLKNSLVVKVWSNSGNKYPRYLANNVCSGLKHAWMHDHSGNTLMFWPLHQQRHKDRFKLVSWVFPTVQKTQPKDGRCSMNIMDIATPLWMWSHEAILFRA